jgi:hypothetical protein
MDTYQLIWLIILTPIFFFYGLKELLRGWKILKHGEFSPNLAVQIRIWLIGLINGADVAKQYEMHLKDDLRTMRMMGIYSIIGGIVSLIVSIIWMLVLNQTL